MADQQAQDPIFQIQRVYLKDLSLEQPNSPAILLEQEQPTVDIQLGVDAQPVADGIFEITVSATGWASTPSWMSTVGCSCSSRMAGELGCSSDRSFR